MRSEQVSAARPVGPWQLESVVGQELSSSGRVVGDETVDTRIDHVLRGGWVVDGPRNHRQVAAVSTAAPVSAVVPSIWRRLSGIGPPVDVPARQSTLLLAHGQPAKTK